MRNTFEVSQNLYTIKKNTNQYIPDFVDPRIYIVSKWMGENHKILDAGCYDGTYSALFKKGNNTVYGIDASKDGVARAKNLGVIATVGDLEATFPYKDAFFDIVHAGEVIEHLYDTDTFLQECKRVLKKGGHLIITTPNVVSLPRRFFYFFGNGKFFEASNTLSTEEKAVGHIRFFYKDLLKNFVERDGFRMINYTSDVVNFPGGFAWSWLAKVKPTFGRLLIMRFEKL